MTNKNLWFFNPINKKFYMYLEEYILLYNNKAHSWNTYLSRLFCLTYICSDALCLCPSDACKLQSLKHIWLVLSYKWNK